MYSNKQEQDRRPFFEKEFSCPVCGKPSIHYYLRDRTYVVDRREDDYFISRYTWRKPEHKRYHIYAFHIWHCPHCKFTDERTSFFQKQFKKARGQFEHLQRKVLEEASTDPVVKLISEQIEYPTVELLSVLNLHLLATYLQLLAEDKYRDYEKLGRLYLRISWIFRILSPDPKSSGMNQFIMEFFNLFDHLQNHILNTLNHLEDLNWLVRQEAESAPTRAWDLYLKKYDPQFRQLYQTTLRTSEQMIHHLGEYSTLGERIKSDFLTSTHTMFNLPYPPYSHYFEFLETLRQNGWQEVPFQEEDALRQAEIYYSASVAAPDAGEDKFKRFKIRKLIIILNEKLRKYQTALQQLDKLYDETVQLKRVAHDRLEKIECEEADNTFDPFHLKNIVKRSREILTQLDPIRKRLLEAIMEKNERTARTLYNHYPDVSPEALQQILEDAGIDESIITRYARLRKQEQRKGIFQLFRFSGKDYRKNAAAQRRESME